MYFCDSTFTVVYNFKKKKKGDQKKRFLFRGDPKLGFISDLALIQRFTMHILRPPEVITASVQWVKVTRGDAHKTLVLRSAERRRVAAEMAAVQLG